MRIVLSVGSTDFALQEMGYLAQQVSEHVVGVIVEDRTSFRFQWRSLIQRLKRYGLIRTINQILLVVYRRIAVRAPSHHGATPADRDLLGRWDVLRVRSMKDPEVRKFILSRQADVLVNLATGIMRPDTFSAPRLGAINIHAGMNPKYRGADPNFWAVHANDFEWIGTTIHQIDAGVDTGAILYRQALTLEPSDTIESLTRKSVHQGVLAAIDLLRHYESAGNWGEPRIEAGAHAESGLYGWYGLTHYLKGERNLARYLSHRTER
jgi:hypothetical protein